MSSEPSRQVLFLPRRARHGRHTRWRAAVSALDERMANLERRLTGMERRSTHAVVTTRMRTSFTVSLGIHLAVIFGIGITLPAKPDPDKTRQSLEIVLVNAKSKSRPVVADAEAQHNLDGGGNTDEKRRAQTPLPATPQNPQSDADVKLALRRVEQLEREARQVLSQKKPSTPVETAPPSKATPAPEADSKADVSAAEILQRSSELARLEAKISKDWDAYQERPRRRFIGSRTQESRFARYVEDWRQKIERVGDMNYPQGARDQRLHGQLVVTVAIRADGSVESVDINRPSGHRVLDDAARRIVQLAGPFAPFPESIAKDVDILHITRTWTFTTGERFRSE